MMKAGLKDNRPIGVFDSGLGGLCALKELKKLLPNEHFVYFGDTGRTPYGTRSEEKITEYAASDVRFLQEHNVKAILAACGTVSAIALERIKDTCSVPLFGIIDSASRSASAATKNGKIGVMGTGATVKSGVFETKLSALGDYEVYKTACPLLVPIVENNLIDTEIAYHAIKHYMSPLVSTGVDTVILGCTHFPLLSEKISEIYPDLTLINSGAEAAVSLAEYLRGENMLCDEKNGLTEYFVSDVPNNFDTCAAVFMGGALGGEIKKIDIE